MIVYRYNEKGFFIGKHKCQKGKLDEYIKPPFCTEIKPPEFESNQIPKFENNKWNLLDNNFGKIIYNTTTKQRVFCESFEIPNEHTTEEPSDFDVWNGGGWSINLDEYKNHKINLLKSDTDQHINDKYPIYKQINSINEMECSLMEISLATDKTCEELKQFIFNKIKSSNKTLKELKESNIDFSSISAIADIIDHCKIVFHGIIMHLQIKQIRDEFNNYKQQIISAQNESSLKNLNIKFTEL